jgi:molybdopterin/thiamine biosynthesis adenylyltransferase
MISYNELTERNWGILTKEQQEILKNSKVCIPGIGGLGGVIFEILVRTGVGSFSIVDNDKIEPTNANRHIFAFNNTMGEYKVDVAERFAKNINSEVKIDKFIFLDKYTAEYILKDCNVIALCIDNILPCVMIDRKAKELNIPIVEGWALPFMNVRVLEKLTIEKAYDIEMKNKLAEISKEEMAKDQLKIFSFLSNLGGGKVKDYYLPEAIKMLMETGRVPSFAPLVWATASIMSLETIKVLLRWEQVAVDCDFRLYDPFDYKTIWNW